MELLYAAVDHGVRQLAEAGEDGAAWLRERLPRAAALPAVELMTLTSFCVAHVRARAAAYAANPDAATATAADAAMMRAVMSCAPEMAAVLLVRPRGWHLVENEASECFTIFEVTRRCMWLEQTSGGCDRRRPSHTSQ